MMATDETADARIAPVATGSGAGGAGYGCLAARTRRVEGIPTRIGDRHAFVHERALVYIALETRSRGGVRCSKREMAELLGVNLRTVDRAMTRLRGTGEVESAPRHDETGAQVSNEYRATAKGLAQADGLIARAFALGE
ncbi:MULTISPECIES: hypothetical protein [Enorma]|uniref:hypothetical protein n=1 Tax=Enorma TaxID=1472762 RepID=UPI000345A408|nr:MULTISPECIES: hypothetical protein [Enorma]